MATGSTPDVVSGPNVASCDGRALGPSETLFSELSDMRVGYRPANGRERRAQKASTMIKSDPLVRSKTTPTA
jgi:hypothetical protein